MLLPRERKIIFVLLLMTFISMIFETLGIGLIIPAVGLLTRPDYVTQFPVAESAAERVFSLPMGPDLLAADQDRVIEALFK